jgi:hypothetical protein
VLRFKPPVEKYEEDSVRLNSRGFIILRPLESSTSASRSSSDPGKQPANEVGVKIAIALGSILGVLTIFGVGTFCVLAKRLKKVEKQVPQHQHTLELNADSRLEPLELQARTIHELPGDINPQELPSAVKPEEASPTEKAAELMDSVKNDITVEIQEVDDKALGPAS